MTGADWRRDIFQALVDLDVRQVAFVPDAGHTRLIEMCCDDSRIVTVPLTTEEEGVALLAGAWLGGQRGALLMQSSGVGNCINMLTLVKSCRFPALIIVAMRGQWGETNPWQMAMGQATTESLRLMGVVSIDADRAEEVGAAVKAAGDMAFNGAGGAAVLLSQRLIGAKVFED